MHTNLQGRGLTMLKMEKLTFRTLAREIAEREGKKQEVNIAQISEILRITLTILAEELYVEPLELVAFLKRYA